MTRKHEFIVWAKLRFGFYSLSISVIDVIVDEAVKLKLCEVYMTLRSLFEPPVHVHSKPITPL